MKKYNNYKNLTLLMKLENLYKKMFSTRLRRIIFHSMIAFAGGISLAWGVLYIASNLNVEKGVGGFEASAPTEYIEENSEISAVSVSAENSSSAESSSDGLAELDELALIDSLSENDAESDSLDAAAAVAPHAGA